MANVGDLITKLGEVTTDLRSAADQTKTADVPQDSGEKMEKIIITLQGIKGDIGGAQAIFVQQYQALLDDSLASFVSLSNEIGGDVQEQIAIFKSAFDAQSNFIVVASACKRPPQAMLVKLLQPTSEAISSVQEFREKKRSSPFFNHLSAVSDTIPALGWVTMEPKPGQFVKEMSDAGQFYTNRVLKEFKGKDVKHVNWVKALMKLFKDLHDYVLKYHTTGLVWTKQGKDAQAGAAPAPAAAGGPPPPPPPPPPAADLPPSSASAPAEDRNALFSELNKGADITKGLKKVTSEMQTHKNPSLRQGPKPFNAPKPFDAPKPFKPTSVSAPKPAAPKAKKEPKLALEQKKWVVEHFEGNPNVEVNVTQMKQSVYVFKCINSTIQVKGKVNSVILDNCKKVGLVMENALSAVDVINSQSVKLQITGKVPIINIDKTDGFMVYLSSESLQTEFVTAKSSEMNVLIPQADGEFKEYAIPEQFRTSWDGKKLQTECAEVVG